MMTGYTTDKVSPSGQLEPPSPKDFPNFGSNIIRLKPPTEPMLPFVMLPRPLQESNVVGKAGTAGFLGKAFDPYNLYPSGDDMDMKKMDRLKTDDLEMRPEVFAARLRRRARLRDAVNEAMPEIDKAVERFNLNEYYNRALSLIISGRARNAFDIQQEPEDIRNLYGRNTFGQSCLLARRLVEAGTRGRRSHLAQSRQLRQSLMGRSRRPYRPHAKAIRPHARQRILRPANGFRPTRNAGRHSSGCRWASLAAVPSAESALPATTTATTDATIGPIATLPASPAAASSAATFTANPTKLVPLRWKTPCIPANCSPPFTTQSASTRKPLSTTTSINRAN